MDKQFNACVRVALYSQQAHKMQCQISHYIMIVNSVKELSECSFLSFLLLTETVIMM
jgi:hypothetical protein